MGLGRVRYIKAIDKHSRNVLKNQIFLLDISQEKATEKTKAT
jgi:hypothetical protein